MSDKGGVCQPGYCAERDYFYAGLLCEHIQMGGVMEKKNDVTKGTTVPDGGPAFPYCVWVGDFHSGHNNGISKREWFAGMVATGSVSFLESREIGITKKLAKDVARNAFALADALIAESEKSQEGKVQCPTCGWTKEAGK